MISHPIAYYRNYKNDFPQIFNNKYIERAKSIAQSTIPLLALNQTLRGPLALGLGALRTVTNGQKLLDSQEKGEVAYHFAQTTLSTVSVAYAFLNPSLGIVLTSLSDAIENIRKLALEGNVQAAFNLLMDVILIASICYAAVEFTLAVMVLQILFESVEVAQNFQEGKWIESGIRLLFITLQIKMAIPQAKFLNWKWKYNPEFEGTLRQDSHGFVYLDIPDEYIHQLHKLYEDLGIELPPYFGENSAGGHVTVITKQEALASGIEVSEQGQKVNFRVAGVDSVYPEARKEVWIATAASSELEAIRSRYGLTSKVAGHYDFHFTFGERYFT